MAPTIGADYNGRVIIDTLKRDNISHDHVWQIPETLTSGSNVFVNPRSEAAFPGWKWAKAVIITSAETGSVVSKDGEIWEQPSFNVEIVNTPADK